MYVQYDSMDASIIQSIYVCRYKMYIYIYIYSTGMYLDECMPGYAVCVELGMYLYIHIHDWCTI